MTVATLASLITIVCGLLTILSMIHKYVGKKEEKVVRPYTRKVKTNHNHTVIRIGNVNIHIHMR